MKPSIAISGKIKIPLPNSKAFEIYKSFVYENERDGEIYAHFDGMKKPFKFEPNNSKKEDYLKVMKAISCFDHTSFGPFIIEEPLNKLAEEKTKINLSFFILNLGLGSISLLDSL